MSLYFVAAVVQALALLSIFPALYYVLSQYFRGKAGFYLALCISYAILTVYMGVSLIRTVWLILGDGAIDVDAERLLTKIQNVSLALLLCIGAALSVFRLSVVAVIVPFFRNSLAYTVYGTSGVIMCAAVITQIFNTLFPASLVRWVNIVHSVWAALVDLVCNLTIVFQTMAHANTLHQDKHLYQRALAAMCIDITLTSTGILLNAINLLLGNASRGPGEVMMVTSAQCVILFKYHLVNWYVRLLRSLLASRVPAKSG